MRTFRTRTAILCFAMVSALSAKEATTPAAASESVSAPVPKDTVLEAKSNEQEALAIENKLAAERLIHATNAMRAEVTRLKLERELATEKLAMETAKRQTALQEKLSKMQVDKAKELKWVNHIVTGIDETSFTKDPDTGDLAPSLPKQIALTEEIDSSGKPFVSLPRLNPMDVYFIHNSDDNYRTR